MAVGDDELLVTHLAADQVDQAGVGDSPDAVVNAVLVGDLSGGAGLLSQQGVDLSGVVIKHENLAEVRAGGSKEIEAVGAPRERAGGVLVRAIETEEAPYELAMMTFINMNSPGLVILPTHRVVHSLPAFSAESFQAAARAYFNVEEVDPAVDAARATAILREAAHVGTAMLAVTPSRVFLLHTPKAPPSMFPGLSVRQQFLDVVQLHKVLLQGVLNLSEESIRDQQNLSYVREAGDALATVRSGAANVAFLMNPCRVEQVRDIAFAGEVLPQKSTDFFPKLLSGLTIYALE